jgi:hypothetical protein
MLAVLAGCSKGSGDDADGSSEDLSTASSQPVPFDVNALVPHATKTFQTPTGHTEICIVPKHFEEDGFTDKDRKKEAKLCGVDFNAAPGSDSSAGGLAPKQNSTNPATDVMEVTTDVSRDVVESFAEGNAKTRKAKKIGRIKSSLDDRFNKTTSYAPSLVGYYGTSRMLGNIAEITQGVWRTIDVAHHARVAANGKALTIVGSQNVRPGWAAFAQLDAQSGSKGNLTYTSDGAQVYGVFIPQVSGDEKDKQIDTKNGLSSSTQFKHLTDASPIKGTIGKDLKSAVGAIVPMQGVVEMLVLDALMLQADRLSGDNVSFIQYNYFQKPDGTVDKLSQKDLDDLKTSDPSSVTADAVPVHKLFLNDVDSGLIGGNPQQYEAGSEFAFLKRMAHISPDLYTRLRKLSGLVTTPDFESFAKTEWRYTDRDWARYKEMTTTVANLLHDRCTAGSLILDLDIAAHMAGTSHGPREGCD